MPPQYPQLSLILALIWKLNMIPHCTMFVRVHTCTCVCSRVSMCVSVYVCVFVYMCAHMHACLH